MTVRDVTAALGLLERLGAPRRLVRHHALVAEAAQQILDDLGDLGPGSIPTWRSLGQRYKTCTDPAIGTNPTGEPLWRSTESRADDRLACSLVD